MAAVAYGFDREAGGMTGPRTYAGVPEDIWNTWSTATQDLYRSDYLRSDSQANYYDNWCANNPTACAAYIYTGVVDHYTGGDAAQSADTGLVDDIQEAGYGSYEDTKDTLTETATDIIDSAVDVTKDITLLAVLAGAFLLTRK